MMRVGFEVVHGNSSMIHAPMHETWDLYQNNLAPAPSLIVPFPKPPNENQNQNQSQCLNIGQNNEIFDNWVDNIAKHLVEDLPEETTTTHDDNNNNLVASATTTKSCPTTWDRLHGSDAAIISRHNNLVASLPPNINPRKTTFWRTPFDPFTNYNFDPHHHTIQTNTTQLDHNNNINHDHQGLSLITLLMECAVAISVDNLVDAQRMLLELTQLASPYKPSCAERVVAYFSKAMSSRVMNSFLGVCSPLIDHKSIHSSFQVFNNISPFIKFAHFTSNQAILEAMSNCQFIHIIDLDIMQGLQWPAFFHILATRIEGPPEVKLTGFGASVDLLVETGKQLSNFARRLGMSLKFHPIATKFGEIDASMIQIRPNEAIAVHWLQHSLYDATGPDWKTLRLIEELEPRIITLVEQDVNIGGSFLDRFVGSLHYYSTIFDSLGAYLPIDDTSRNIVEHGLLSKEINNILAIGGPARSGEDKFRSWRGELAARNNGCLVQVPMSANSMAQAQLILNMFSPSHHGYSLAHVDGMLRLGWKDTSLYTASAWTCTSASSA